MKNESNVILTPTSPGELIDKITVLRIKRERIKDEGRLLNVNNELLMLEEVRKQSFPKDENLLSRVNELEMALKKSNEEIWDMGDKIREYGERKDFGDDFVKVAWGIHISNDRRAAIKKEINLILGSSLIEEKSYKNWE